MYEASGLAVAIFIAFVAFVLWISYYFAKRTQSAKGYFAAGGQIHWAVNGIAFAGDYLSAASFTGPERIWVLFTVNTSPGATLPVGSNDSAISPFLGGPPPR